MLRIEEIVGAMDDEFRYALDALGDDRLAELAVDKAALRRLRPVGVSHAEAMAMIAAIQARREAARERRDQEERRKAARAARRKANPRKSRAKAMVDGAPLAEPAETGAAAFPTAMVTTASLPAPPAMARLAPPCPAGPAIRLPPPAAGSVAIPLPAPRTAPTPLPAIPEAACTPRRPARRRIRVAVILALGGLAALALAIL